MSPGADPPPALLRAGMRAASNASRGLGRVAHVLADGAALVAYATHRDAALRTARNHRRPDPGLSDRAAARRARASFREYGRMVVDSLGFIGLDDRALAQRVSVVGWEHIDEARQRRRGAVLAMCHFGSWDIAVTVGLARGLRIATVMAPVGPPWFTDLVAWERRCHGLELHSLDHAALGFVRALRRGDFVGVMTDIPERGPTTVVSFCGGPVRFSSVAARLAIRTGAPILPVDCHRTGSHHLLQVHPPLTAAAGEDESALTQRLAAILEPVVLGHPEQWYPFHEVFSDDPVR